ncbi:MAG TPA: tRNA pseudouridine(38-40) synthase TruA, partial [Halomonas sp.]|nr:tRNA pseudouridine(38-40) synthase TruA [Pseudomonadota bacterium]MEE3267659.1 tRNA pseudouridine(38-40) synthase TruA [Pseudomonadota bacterium]HAO01991.1 tRNA pseudouridine(38-40) synthase TruA [Halomonas sp.]HCL22115.1 tRNA pseudouridine(38-40) synthase TruA [Halomonas sp.]
MTLFYHFDETQPLAGRLAMGVEYDGSRFCGFQRLKHAASVQQAIEDALAKVAGAPV